MTTEKTTQDLIYLVSCAVNGKIPDKERIAAMDQDAVFEAADRHLLSACVAFSLESAGYQDARTGKIIASAIRRTLFFENALKSIKKAFVKDQIWFMPLKGALLKEDYPKPVMREFGDYDILFDASREDDCAAIMETLGFVRESSGSHYHLVFRKAPFLIFEMHTALFSNLHQEKICQYYQHVRERLIGEEWEKKMVP